MLSAYFDDSGTDGESTHMVLGGLIGDERQWEHFDERWATLLRSPLSGKKSLSKWHSVDCQNSSKEFSSYTPAERDAVTHDFRKIIFECDMITYAVCVDKSPWKDFFTGDVHDALGEPDEIAFSAVVNFCHKMAEVSLVEPKISIVLDAGWCNQGISAWVNHYLSDEKMNDRVTDISFASVKDRFGLQGADLIATESFWFNKEWIEAGDETEGRAHFRDFRRGELSRGVIYTRSEVRDIANRYLEANSMPLIGEI